MALTKITSDGITDGTITGTDLATNIDLVDNQRLRLGTGNDLEIFHNNDNSFINDSGTGQLMIQASGLRLRNYPEGHTQVNCQDDVVELYYNNSKKLETDTNGITVTGNVDAGSYSFLLNDSGRIRLGTSQDFEIYHDGSNSLIKDAGTGALVLSTNQLLVRNAAVNEFLIQAVENAGVKLYYDNSKKFETLTDGVLVTGKVAATGDLALTSSDGQKIRIGQSNDLQIYHDGTNNYIEGNNQKTIIRNTSNNIHLQAVSGEAGIDVIPNSSVRLYFDGSKKFETVTAGISVTGQVSADNLHIGDGSTGIKVGDSDDLQIYHTGTVSRIQDEGTGGLEITSNGTGVDINKGLSEYMARFLTDGAVMLYHNNLLKFQTTSDGCQLQSNTTDAVFSLRSTAQDGAPVLQFLSDDFDDTADAWRLRADGGGTAFGIQNYASGSWENNIVCQEQGAVKLYYDNSLKFETLSTGAAVTGALSVSNGIAVSGDNLSMAAATDIRFTNSSGTWTGSVPKIQHYNDTLYIVGGTGGIRFREMGQDRWDINGDGHFVPRTDSTYNIGSNSIRVANGYFDTLYGDGSNLTGISGVTVSGQSDNRVLTATGTTDTLQSEPNFTHDSSTCDTKISHYEALKSADLIVENTNPFGNAAGARITIESGSAANTGPQFGMICGSDNWYLQTPKNVGALDFHKNGTRTFRLMGDGDVQIANGDLFFTSAGRGIDFSTQSASSSGGATTNAELLDHYEEGEWTPVGNISGVGGVTLRSPNTCRYTRVGRMVHITARFTPSGSSGSSNLMIGGLPFNSGSANASAFCIMHDGFDEGGSQEPVLMGFVGQSTSNISFYYTRTNGVGWQTVIGTEAVNHEIIFDFCYYTDS